METRTEGILLPGNPAIISIKKFKTGDAVRLKNDTMCFTMTVLEYHLDQRTGLEAVIVVWMNREGTLNQAALPECVLVAIE